MKKIVLFVLSLVCLTACADEPKVSSLDALPSTAKNLLLQCIDSQDILQVLVEGYALDKEYKIVLKDGSEWEFDHKGHLESVEAPTGVPDAAIPAAILTYVKTHYPKLTIVEYSIDHHEQEVELSSGIELVFDSKGNFLRLDDIPVHAL